LDFDEKKVAYSHQDKSLLSLKISISKELSSKKHFHQEENHSLAKNIQFCPEENKNSFYFSLILPKPSSVVILSTSIS